MTDSTWTWLLFAMELVGVTGLLAVGRHHWWGWAILLAHSIPWLAYSIGHHKPGFVAMTALWWTTHLHNAIRWRRHNPRNTR